MREINLGLFSMFKRYLKGHFSFVLLALFSASYFAAMVAAKKVLEPEDFYLWNVYITLIAASFSFCFIGSEQLLLRFSKVADEGVVVNANTLLVMGGSLFLYSSVVALVMEEVFLNVRFSYFHVLVAFIVGVFVFVYNYLRLVRRFVLSQLSANGWKVILLLAVLLWDGGSVELLVVGSLGVACISSIIALAFLRRLLIVRRESQPADWKQLYVGFGVSLFVMMLMGNVDRFLMGRYTSPEEFSSYVYLVSMLVMPFSILSNYFGFREVSALKARYSKSLMRSKLIKIGGASAIFFGLWFAALMLFSDYLEIELYIYYFIPALFIVVLRNVYALLSALFGLHGTPRQIQLANGITLFSVAAMVMMIVLIGPGVTAVLWLIAGFWLLRFVLYWYFTAVIPDYCAGDSRAV